MKNKKQLRKRVAVAALVGGLSSSITFGVIAAVIAGEQIQALSRRPASQAPVLISAAFDGGVIAAQPPFIPEGLPDSPVLGETPRVLYHLPVIDEAQITVDRTNPLATATQEYVRRYFNNMNLYRLFQAPRLQQFSGDFATAYAAITASFSTENQQVIENAQAALRNFTDMSTVGNNFDAINGLGATLSPTARLNITQPDEVRDVLSAEFNGDSVVSQGLLNDRTVSYKVAEVNLAELAKVSSLALEFKDRANAQVDDHDYRIIISNEHEEIKRFVDAVQALPEDPLAERGTITELINDRTIFVRDLERTTASSFTPGPTDTSINAPRLFSDKLTVVYHYDEDKQAPMLSFMVRPDENNKAAGGIEIAVDETLSDPGAIAQSVLRFGLLDTSVSPRHTKLVDAANRTTYPELALPVDPRRALIPLDPLRTATQLLTFSGTAQWTKRKLPNSATADYNMLRFFMMPRAEISQAMQFRGKAGDNVFADLDSTLRINYSQDDTILISPSEVGILAKAVTAAETEAAQNNLPPFNLEAPLRVFSKLYDVANLPPVTQYAQIDLALTAGVVGFSYDVFNNDLTAERPYFLQQNAVDKIFFEDPFAQGESDFLTHTSNDITTLSRPEVSNRDLQLVSEIVRNWAGLESDPQQETYIQPNSEYFSNDKQGLFAATSDNRANFNQRLAETFPGDGFGYTYKQYALIDDAVTLVAGTSGGVYTGRYAQNLTTMAFEGVASGAPRVIDASGQAVYDHFVAYNNALVKWSIDRFGLQPNEGGLLATDAFKLDSVNAATGFTRTNLIERAGDEGKDLMRIAGLLVRLWIGDLLGTDDETAVTNLFTKFETVIPQARTLIAGRGGSENTATPEYRASRQIIYYLLQPYLVRVFNRIMQDEVARFEQNRVRTLGIYFNEFLNGTTNKTQLKSGLTSDIALSTPINSLVSELQFIGLMGYGVESSKNGRESLRSLFTFINETKLRDRFLTSDESIRFGTLAGPENKFEILDDTDLFTDETKRQSFIELMNLTSSILGSTLGDRPGLTSLAGVIDKLQSGRYLLGQNKNAPVEDIEAIVAEAVNTIGREDSFEKFDFYGTNYQMTFLETLVIGRNLGQIVNRYMSLYADKLSATDAQALKDFVDEQREFKVGSLFNFMVARGISVRDYFVDSLTNRDKVEQTALEYLGPNSDLAKSVTFRVDSGVQALKSFGNVASYAQYFMIAIGVAAAITGISALGLSFRRAIRSSGRRNVVLERSFFIVIGIIGIALIIVGAIFPGIL